MNHHHHDTSKFETLFENIVSNSTGQFNNTECAQWLLSLSLVPRERNIPGQCPDAISVPILAGISFVFYITLVSFSIFGFIWKRNSTHIKARSTAGMHFTIFSSISTVSVYSLRYLIGRNLFPCLIYSLMFFMMPASFAVPNILRNLRVYTQWRVNWFKAQNFKEQELKKNELDENCKETNQNSVRLPSTSRPNLERSSSHHSVLTRSPSSPTMLIPKNQEQLKEFKQYLNLHNKMEKRELMYRKAHHIFHSSNWSIFIFCCVYGFHGLIWFTFAVVEESFFSNSRIFMQEASLISLKGCYALLPTSITIIVLYVIYFILEVGCLLLVLKTEKDAYFIKVETIVTMVFQVVSVIFYASLVMDYFKMYDHVFPSGLTMVFYCSVEIFITVTLPVVYAIVKDFRNVEIFNNELEFILNRPDTCEVLLEYSRKSYCPEGVLVYKDINKFKNASTFKKRKLIALEIVNCYLTVGGVYELNLPNMNSLREEILFKINSAMCDEELSEDLFGEVNFQTLLTLKDVLERLRNSNEKVRTLLEERKEKEMREFVPSSPKSTPTLTRSFVA